MNSHNGDHMDTKTYITNLTFYDLDNGWSQDENGEKSLDFVYNDPKFYGEDSRISRLATTWGRACAAVSLMSNKYQRLFAGAVVEMGDRKGTLEVLWRDDLSRVMFEGVVCGAWEANGEHCHVHGLANGATA